MEDPREKKVLTPEDEAELYQWASRMAGARMTQGFHVLLIFKELDRLRGLEKGLLDRARLYQEDDGSPGPLASEWGWRSIARILRELAGQKSNVLENLNDPREWSLSPVGRKEVIAGSMGGVDDS